MCPTNESQKPRALTQKAFSGATWSWEQRLQLFSGISSEISQQHILASLARTRGNSLRVGHHNVAPGRSIFPSAEDRVHRAAVGGRFIVSALSSVLSVLFIRQMAFCTVMMIEVGATGLLTCQAVDMALERASETRYSLMLLKVFLTNSGRTAASLLIFASLLCSLGPITGRRARLPLARRLVSDSS